MTERVVVIGASLAGLRGAEALRRLGFAGSLVMVGDEPHRPYDRPPLSKRVLNGEIPADGVVLPNLVALDAEWQLGRKAVGLDLKQGRVSLDNGVSLAFDQLMIATGARARAWPNAEEARLPGLFTLRGRDDAVRLRDALARRPARVLVIGAGFIGCEVASCCRDLGLPVTVVDPNPTPLARVMGRVLGEVVAGIVRDGGVDLRMGVQVEALEAGPDGTLAQAVLTDGSSVETTVAVAALGAVRDMEWLQGSGLHHDPGGLDTDGWCRVLGEDGHAVPGIVAAGDVARWPHPLYGERRVALEHWGNAVEQAGFAAATLRRGIEGRPPFAYLPAFWSAQFGMNIKSVGLADHADQLVFANGSAAERRFLAVMGQGGRTVAAFSFNSARWLPAYAEQIAAMAPCPPIRDAADQNRLAVLDPAFPKRASTHQGKGQTEGGPHG